MLLEWFNAREATRIGAMLADFYLPDETLSPAKRHSADSGKNGRSDLQKFLQRVAREAAPLKLNLFKRAKLLNTFKWRLLERGIERKTADDLTELVLLQLSGNSKTALPNSFTTSKRTHPRRSAALFAEADTYFAEGKYKEAAACYREALAIEPRHAAAHVNLGALLCKLGRYGEAETEFRRAIDISVTSPGAHLALGGVLRAKGDFAAAETALRRAVKQNPRDAQALVELGLTIAMLSKLADARICFEKAIRLKPQHPDALCGLGLLAKDEGRFDEAEKLFESVLKVEPHNATAWAMIARLRRMTPADSKWIEGVARTLGSGLQPLEEAKLRFSMGKYFDDLGKYPRAFAEYKRGNELCKAIAGAYDRDARKHFADDVIRVYAGDALSRSGAGAIPSQTPVFVVGMPRSGTSLMEQIIASHPQAAGAGELDFWNSAVHQKHQSLRGELPNDELSKKLGNSYLALLTSHAARAVRIVDKTPFNADILGVIHRILPNARMIYMRRDPIDTCLSCYFQDFANMAPFTLDLADLAHYYREHHRLMRHWRTVLPAGTLLEVPYEELVLEQEAWSRRVVEFIGLEWDAKCLEFHRTQRPVLTASNWQVRQKVYSSAVGRWRNYQKFIGPLLELSELKS